MTVVVATVVVGCGGAAEREAGPDGSPAPMSSSPSTVALTVTPPPAGAPAPSPDDGSAGAVATPTARPTSSASVAEEALRITFVTGGGCYDSAEPVGCGELVADPVRDPGLRASIVEDAQRLSAVPDGDNGCGGEYVDGVSVRAVVEAELAELAPIWTICLSNVPDDDPTGRALWRLYELSRER